MSSVTARQSSPSVHETSDATLVSRLAAGDDGAMVELQRRHRPAVSNLVARLLFNHLLGEEVVQDVFVSLWRAPERFVPSRGALRTYLLTRAHAQSIDVLRSEDARRRREGRAEPLLAWAPAVDDAVMDMLERDELCTALDALPERLRTVIVMAFFGEYSYRDTADLLALPEGTAKSQIKAALRALRATLRPSAI